MKRKNSDDDSDKPKKALIYCRVSSKKQDVEGSGLSSQEYRCREFAAQKGYQVEAVFPDDVTGGGDFMKRPGMVALLAYLDAFPQENFVVIFDDLKRYARDVEFHLKLKREMTRRNAQRECLNFKFEDTPEGKFIETVMAAQGELEREQNGRQVRQKMRARLDQGFWVSRQPIGYRYEKSKRGGKVLVRDEPLASIVQEALEGYACGRFESQVEVKRFFEAQPTFPRNGKGEITQQRVTDILTHPLYAGYIGHRNWNRNLVPAQHEPLISLEIFERIQTRRSGALKAPTRKNLNVDFALRGFVLCHDCDHPLTACWSQGAKKKYAYYLCDTKGCVSYRKSIPRDALEGEFEAILQSMQPTRNLFEATFAMFKEAWNQRLAQTTSMVDGMKGELKTTEKHVANLMERIAETSSSVVVRAYEQKIETLEKKRLLLIEKIHNAAPPKGRFEHVVEHAMRFMANPWNIWCSGDFKLKRTVLRLAFAERPRYARGEGYRTAKPSLPFNILADIHTEKSVMVRMRRFEVKTIALILLCYLPYKPSFVAQ